MAYHLLYAFLFRRKKCENLIFEILNGKYKIIMLISNDSKESKLAKIRREIFYTLYIHSSLWPSLYLERKQYTIIKYDLVVVTKLVYQHAYFITPN